MSTVDSSTDMASQFVALNNRLRGATDGPESLQRLVDLAVAVLPSCDWAAVTGWPLNHRPRSLASSHEVSTAVDLLQYEAGEGPCLTAAADGDAMWIQDVSVEERWPTFCAKVAAETPVRGVLAFHIAHEPHRTALNLYTGGPGAFDAEAFSLAALFAAHARALLMHAASASKAAQLEIALTTSRQIGAAVGILMSVHKITAEAAFNLLRGASQNLHRKVQDIAEDVTETGTLPDQR